MDIRWNAGKNIWNKILLTNCKEKRMHKTDSPQREVDFHRPEKKVWCQSNECESVLRKCQAKNDKCKARHRWCCPQLILKEEVTYAKIQLWEVELKTFKILAAERLRLIKLGTRLIADYFQHTINIYTNCDFPQNDRFWNEKW